MNDFDMPVMPSMRRLVPESLKRGANLYRIDGIGKLETFTFVEEHIAAGASLPTLLMRDENDRVVQSSITYYTTPLEAHEAYQTELLEVMKSLQDQKMKLIMLMANVEVQILEMEIKITQLKRANS